MSESNRFDGFLNDDGPAALFLREHLAPVEGPEGVVFPATYASGDNFPGGYNIDVTDEAKGYNVCLIDSVGSQANRIEPLFAEDAYRKLVPQVIVTAGENAVNLLSAGHRAGDAIVRCSSLSSTLQDGFKAVLKGNAEPMAKIAPTSLVFGVWDSRDTQAKLPRLLASTIRGYNVRSLTRSAQYVPAVEYVEAKLLDEPADKATKDGYSQRGFGHVPATGTHGGVVATGGIRREAILSLTALRLLAVREANGTLSADRTLALRRYILGLSLVALTANRAGYLRQGCLLVLDAGKPREFEEVHPSGKRVPSAITHEQALAYATATAKAFGVGADQTVPFDKEKAKKDAAGEGDTKKTIKAKTKAAEAAKGKSDAPETPK